MQLKTILNRVESFKSFVYGQSANGWRARSRTNARSGGACPKEWSADLLGLRPSGTGLRSAAGAAVRVRAPLWESPCTLCMPCGVSNCRSCGVTVERVPWARGKVPLDDQLPLVPGPLGQAFVLGGGGHASFTPIGEMSSSR